MCVCVSVSVCLYIHHSCIINVSQWSILSTGGPLTHIPSDWFWTLDQPHPPHASLHLPLTVGDGTRCHGVCLSNRTLDSRARDHIKPQNFSAAPSLPPLRDPCTYRPQVFWLSCIAIEVQVNMWNKCSCLSLCVDVQRKGGFWREEKDICSGKGGGRRDWLCIMTRDTVEKIDKDNK